MIEYDVLEDDEIFAEDEESYDDGDFQEDDESDDEFAERRRRRPGGRRAPNIRVSRTGSGRNLIKRTPSRAPVTVANLQASLERVGKDIRANATAIKNLGAQVKSATSRLTKENNTQDSAIASLRSDLRKQGGASSQQNQLHMLLPLLQKTPELEAKPRGNEAEATRILDAVQVKKQDNTLPLVIAMMGAMQQPGTGAGSGNYSMNMMLPMILLLDK